MNENLVTLDVRPDIKNGREPFSRIMQAIAGLGPDQALKLVAPFEPTPLFRVLAQRGFGHHSTALPSGDFEVVFTRDEAAASRPLPPAGPRSCAGGPTLDLDARGLEPPQPMVKILEALSTLPAGARLRACTDRRPMHLYPQLEQRGFRGTSEEQFDGTFVTLIEKVASAS